MVEIERMILLTTSRRPTRRIRTFCSDLARTIPGIIRTNRGKMNLKELAEAAVKKDADRILIIERWKTEPGKIRLCRIVEGKIIQVPPEIHIRGIRLQREFTRGERAVKFRRAIEPMIMLNPDDSEIMMLTNSLSNFLNIPVMDVDKAYSEYQAAICIRRDKGGYISLSAFLLPKMIEIGPRITISRLLWNL